MIIGFSLGDESLLQSFYINHIMWITIMWIKYYMLNRIMIIPYYLVILIPNNGIIWYNNHIIIPKMFRFHLPASLPDWRGLATTLEVLTTHNIEA